MTTSWLPTTALIVNLLVTETALTGKARIHGTDERLRFEPRLGVGISAGAEFNNRFIAETSISRTLVPIAVGGLAEVQKASVMPWTGSLLTRIGGSESVQSYAGVGIVYLFLRHGRADVTTPELHISHLAQPDHPAVLLKSAVRVHISNRWSAVADAQYGPAASTIEVFTAGSHHTMQANVHPLIVSSGFGIRF